MRVIAALLAALLAQGCAYTTFSRQTGGHGTVVCESIPLSGAKVSIADMDGTLSATTSTNGCFAIPGKSRKLLAPLMSNPMYHDVKLRVEKEGYQPEERSIRKSVFSKSYLDFGTINVTKK